MALQIGSNLFNPFNKKQQDENIKNLLETFAVRDSEYNIPFFHKFLLIFP
jgi:hypothetical protein